MMIITFLQGGHFSIFLYGISNLLPFCHSMNFVFRFLMQQMIGVFYLILFKTSINEALNEVKSVFPQFFDILNNIHSLLSVLPAPIRFIAQSDSGKYLTNPAVLNWKYLQTRMSTIHPKIWSNFIQVAFRLETKFSLLKSTFLYLQYNWLINHLIFAILHRCPRPVNLLTDFPSMFWL